MAKYTEADTIDGILQQIARTREELSRLTNDGHQDADTTLAALSVETYLVNRAIISLREQLVLSLSWSDCRTTENQWSIDVLLFAISTTLCNVLNQLDVHEHRRSSTFSFRFLPRETPKPKMADLQTSLSRLREQNSVLQCVMDLFNK